MRNTWLIIRREYLERVRAKSFIVSTILLPAFMFAVTVLPAKLAGMKNQGTRHIAVVASDQHIAEAVAEQLQSPDANSKFKVDVITAENSRRDDLNEQISSGAIDGYLWLTNDAIADGKVTYTARSTSDFIEGQSLRSAVNAGVTRARLNEKGISAAE